MGVESYANTLHTSSNTITFSFVIPAKAGIHLSPLSLLFYLSTYHLIILQPGYLFSHFTLHTSDFTLAERAQHCWGLVHLSLVLCEA